MILNIFHFATNVNLINKEEVKFNLFSSGKL